MNRLLKLWHIGALCWWIWSTLVQIMAYEMNHQQTNFSQTSIKILIFSITKQCFNMLFAKRPPFCFRSKGVRLQTTSFLLLFSRSHLELLEEAVSFVLHLFYCRRAIAGLLTILATWRCINEAAVLFKIRWNVIFSVITSRKCVLINLLMPVSDWVSDLV